VPELRLSSFTVALNVPTGSVQWARWVSLLALVYYVGGRVGQAVPAFGPDTSLLWPPSGIALAAMLRLGVGVWPGVWIGAFLLALSAGSAPWLAALLASGHTLGPALATYWLRGRGLHLKLDRRRDLWMFVIIGIGAAMLVTASNAVVWHTVSGALRWNQLGVAWLHAWLGDALGALALGVPLLTLSRASLARAFGQSHWAPTLILSLGAIASGWLALAVSGGAYLVLLPLIFLPHLLVGWLAARSGIFAASSTALLVSVGAALATVNGLGPLQQVDPQRSVALLWGYVFTLVSVPLLMSTLVGELAAGGRRWKRALEASDTDVAELDMVSGRLELSPRWLGQLGFATQEFGHSVAAFWERVHPDDIGSVKRSFEPLRSAAAADARADCRLLGKDGHWRWFELRAFVVDRDADGVPLRMLFLARDSAERHAALERERLADCLFQNVNEGLLITDAQNRVLQANPTYCRITGFALDELLGTVPAMLRAAAPGTAEAEAQTRVYESLRAHGVWRGEMVTRRRNGEACTLHATVSVVKSPEGLVQNHVLALSDVTQARQQIVQLQRQAHFDELTGLPNRVRLTQLLLEALAAAERDGSLLTVCYLDLDHFKPVNDEHGHYAGDELLLKLAERLRRSLRTSASGDDVVARIGGDEFVLLLRAASVEESRLAVERMLHIVGLPFGLSAGDAPVAVTASIGATVFPIDNADAETLLRHADHAMYGAKQAGRSGYQFFDAERDRLAEARFVELGRVQEALDAQELCLHFQPKVDMRDGRVLGVEALLRWNHPEQGLLTPAHFLPLIEHTGLSTAVGDWVLRQGIEQLARWQSIGLDLTVSINVSARHLQEPMFARNLADLLAAQRLPVADRLVLEVLETTALADINFTCGLMEECRALGVRFALDDFGTGYSTLTYLKRLPLDMLKIDRSFVINMLNDRQDMAIVEGVIGLSQTFGCTVVAEGVETLEQAQALIEIGCDIGQGNGIAHAMPADEVIAWVHSFGGMETMAAPLPR
jgi:diguanylate cyclase (GGDEF)-like protein/PAS domain S-box-containing protein